MGMDQRLACFRWIRPSLREFPVGYWKYLLVIAIFEIGNSSNSFLILQTKSIGASFAVTMLIYAGFNLVAALISYPAGSLSDRWGSMGWKKHPAGVVRDLFRRVSWLCSYQKRGSDCRLVRLLRIVSGNISVGRQGTCFGLRARTPARQCRRLVQRSHRTSGIGRKRCSWFVVGQRQSRFGVLLRCDLCYCWQRRIALYSRKTQPVRR